MTAPKLLGAPTPLVHSNEVKNLAIEVLATQFLQRDR